LDDDAFLGFLGLFDFVFGSLGFLLRDLLGLDGIEVFFHEGELGDGEVIDLDVEVGGTLRE
jgi:hypothetical protein